MSSICCESPIWRIVEPGYDIVSGLPNKETRNPRQFPPQILRPEELVTEQIMVFEGEQSKTDKLQFIEAGASHDNSPDEGEEEEDLVQAGVVQMFVKRIMRSVCVAFQTNVFCAEHRILFCCNGSVYLYFALRIWNFQQELYIFLQGNATLYCGWPKLLHRFFQTSGGFLNLGLPWGPLRGERPWQCDEAPKGWWEAV